MTTTTTTPAPNLEDGAHEGANEVAGDDAAGTFVGRYRLLERVGQGGMGVVYAGEHPDLQTRVAIKLLQPALSNNENARARFLREARLAASIDSEHSTRIYDVGVVDSPFMVMEFLVGESLDTRLAREGRLSLADAATVGMQVLDVLAEAHSKHLVHRDLKPANLFLVDRPGEIIWTKVMDFGISKSTITSAASAASAATTTASASTDADDDSSDATARQLPASLTSPRTPLGSPEYMSPEQLRDSSSVGSKSDLWSFGVLLHELLAGDVPFTGGNLPELCKRIVNEHAIPLAKRTDLTNVVTVPLVVSQLIEACLQKDANNRPKNAYVIASQLAPFASESARALLRRIRARCAEGGFDTDEGAISLAFDHSLDDGVDSPRKNKSRRPRVVVGLSLVLAAGAVAFGAASVGNMSPGGTAGGSSPPPSIASSLYEPPPQPTPLNPVSAAPPPASAPTSSNASPAKLLPTRPTSSSQPSRRSRDPLDGIDLIQ